jgi:signal transduction histidine kinase
LQRFVSDAAHELNTPLTALRTNLELMSEEKDQEVQRTYMEHAFQQTRRLEELTAALLDLSKLESGSSEESENQINLTALIQEESERFASTAEQKGLEFSVELPDQEIQWMGRPNQIRRVLSNLLDNAIKFTPEGGSVKLGLMSEESNILLWIEDTGIGIPEAEISHLFQRFHRAPNASSYPGSGLGLAIVKTIVEAHRGRVSVENKEQGVIFTIRIPISSDSK